MYTVPYMIVSGSYSYVRVIAVMCFCLCVLQYCSMLGHVWNSRHCFIYSFIHNSIQS